MENMHFLLDLLAQQKPEGFSVVLDGTEIFKGKFTDSGIETILDASIDINKPRWLMTIFFDGNPTPVYSLSLDGETG